MCMLPSDDHTEGLDGLRTLLETQCDMADGRNLSAIGTRAD